MLMKAPSNVQAYIFWEISPNSSSYLFREDFPIILTEYANPLKMRRLAYRMREGLDTVKSCLLARFP